MTKTYALDSLETEIITLLQHLHVGASITLTKKLTESGDVAVEFSIADEYFSQPCLKDKKQKSLETFLSWRKKAKADGTFTGWTEDDNPWKDIRDASTAMRENPWT